MRSASASRVATMLAAVVLVSCGAGSAKLLGVPVQHPVGLVIKATPEVVAHSDLRGLRDLADELIEGMKEKGVSAYVVEEGRPMPPPRLELFVKRWDAPGGKRMSASTASSFFGLVGAGAQIAHAEDVELECTVFRESEHTPADQHFFVGETASSVAGAIVSRVFTDQSQVVEPPPVKRGGEPQ